MKKHNNQIRIAVGLSIVILIGILIFFLWKGDYIFPSKTFAIGDVPAGCNVAGQGTTDNEFTCPSVCDVNGWSDCETFTTQDQIVILRTNINMNSYGSFSKYYVVGNWITLDVDGDGYMEKYIKYSGFKSDCYYDYYNVFLYKDKRVIEMPDGAKIYLKRNSDGIHIGGNNYCVFFKKTSSSTPDITPTPKEPYNSNNQEIYESGGASKVYSCSKDWKILTSGNSIKERGTAVYSSGTSGKYQIGIKRISADEKIIFPGKINYAIVDTTDSCAIDSCLDDNSGYVKCNRQSDGCYKKGQTINCESGTFCVQTASGASCSAPFTETLNIGSFEINNPITFTYNLKSDRVNSATVTFKLIDTRNPTQIIAISGPTNLNLPTTKTINFPSQGLIGTYAIIVEKEYSGQSLEDTKYEFRIGNPLTTIMKIPYSPLTGSQLFINGDIYVDVEVSENGILTTDLANILITARLRKSLGNEVTLTNPTPIIKNDAYRFIYKLNEPGLFIVEAQADKFGVLSNKERREAEIRQPKIDIKYTNMGELISNVPGSLTITFETLDYAGEYLDTQNEVKIIPSGASVGRDDIIVTNLVQRKSKGKYEFTYNFDRGTYIIEIKSTSNLYSIETSLKSPSIFIEEGNTPPECTESTQCDAGRICLNNKCVEKDPPFGLYFGIGAISIFVIILLIIIINLMRKSRNINLGGGL